MQFFHPYSRGHSPYLYLIFPRLLDGPFINIFLLAIFHVEWSIFLPQEKSISKHEVHTTMGRIILKSILLKTKHNNYIKCVYPRPRRIHGRDSHSRIFVSSSQINTDSSSFLVCVCFRGSQFQYYIACHGLTFFLKDGHYPHTHDASEIIQIVKAL